MRLSCEQFRSLVARALDDLPPRFSALLKNITVLVEEQADEEVLAAVGVEHPDALLGLYCGVPQTERDAIFVPELPDRVVLYQRPITALCRNRREVIREVRDTLLHEIGHHFGLSDHEMPF